jgi:hypothetical protein
MTKTDCLLCGAARDGSSCEAAPAAATLAGDPTLWTQLGVGSVFKKAQYRQYTDASFQARLLICCSSGACALPRLTHAQRTPGSAVAGCGSAVHRL